MTILHEDPYRLTEVAGVGFARADKIALAADVPPESSRRAQAAAVYALVEAEQQGNTNLPLEELARRAARLLGLAPDPDVLAAAPGLLLDEGRVYREPTHASELAVAATLRARAAAPPHLDHDPGEEPRGEPHRRAVGGGARRLRGAGLGPHRRPRRRQDRLHAADRRRGRSGATRRSPSARRPGARRGGWRRRPGTRRRRSTACSSGCRAASRPSGPAGRCRSTW